MYLLDTNVISELRQPRPHGGVVAWLESVPDAAVHLCASTLGELQVGIEKAREQDPVKASQIEAWVDQVAQDMAVLDIDAPTFRIWAQMIHSRSDTVRDDALVAACAQRHGLTVVTRNVRHFSDFGVPLLDPFAWQG